MSAAKVTYTLKQLEPDQKSKPVACPKCEIAAPPGAAFCSACGLSLKPSEKLRPDFQETLNTLIHVDSLIWCAAAAQKVEVKFPWSAVVDPKSKHYGIETSPAFDAGDCAEQFVRPFYNAEQVPYHPRADYMQMQLRCAASLPDTTASGASEWDIEPLLAHLGVPNISQQGDDGDGTYVKFDKLLQQLVERNICNPQSGAHRIGLVGNTELDYLYNWTPGHGPGALPAIHEIKLSLRVLEPSRYTKKLAEEIQADDCEPEDVGKYIAKQKAGIARSLRFQTLLDEILAQLPPTIYYAGGGFYTEAGLNARLRAEFPAASIDLAALTAPRRVGPCTVRVADESLEALLDSAGLMHKLALAMKALTPKAPAKK